jgi:hypothetical protein
MRSWTAREASSIAVQGSQETLEWLQLEIGSGSKWVQLRTYTGHMREERELIVQSRVELVSPLGDRA